MLLSASLSNATLSISQLLCLGQCGFQSLILSPSPTNGEAMAHVVQIIEDRI